VTNAHRTADIAIIGMSGRFPGAHSVDAFWDNLRQGIESVTFFSDEELLAAGVAPSLLANPNYVKAAPILSDVETFDAGFFGFSPKEAALMDPQHRLFLEVSWEAFENAGYDPYSCPGKVGVIAACGGVVSSYLLAKLQHSEFPGQTASAPHISNDKDFLSTRVSFKLNLRGPSFTIQSACSSSLLAVHQACQTLRLGECDMMLVGGSAVRVPQAQGFVAEKRNLYSLDGHCRPFDAEGQGTIFGSAVGAVLLKPLAHALVDRDRIIAVIKGTAANNDGSGKISYTAPSVGQQAQAVIDAMNVAGTTADRVGFIECHSTGTIVGDPLEIEALSTAFRTQTEGKQYCALASLKANIGHPEQAAGIVGLIKTALVLQHKQIPPSINFETPNPRIDFEASPFYVNTQLRDFPAAGPRQAGLNSLGIGGTNAFAVLEEAPAEQADANARAPFTPIVLISAKTPTALVARVRQLLDWLSEHPQAAIEDVCYTTSLSRAQFAFRFAAFAQTIPELQRQLSLWLQTWGADPAKLKRASKRRIAFMFSGQGPQHAGMAAELYRTRSVFREAMDECGRLAAPYLQQDLLEVIFSEPGGENALVNRTDYTQPALFAVEYALSELLKSWGVKPDAAIGHSLGEITAACVTGVLSVKDAMRLAVARGALMHKVPAGGRMAAIWAEQSVVRGLIDKTAPAVTIAAMNGPLNTVVSGDRDDLARLMQELGAHGINYRELRISNGFHSPRTDPILDELEQIASALAHEPPKLPLVSNLTAEIMRAAPDGSYWRRHTREPVRFGEGMAALGALECQTFLEIGPHPVLLPLAQACVADKRKSAAWVGTLNRQKTDSDSIGEMLAALYLAGHEIDWVAVHSQTRGKKIALPTYPFERKRHWLDDEPVAVSHRQIELRHPLAGAQISSQGNDIIYDARYSLRELGYLSDHRVFGQVFLPTAAELEAITVIGRRHFGTRDVAFEQVMHHQAMTLAEDHDRLVRVLLTPLKSDRLSVKLVSASEDEQDRWIDHMTGILCARQAAPEAALSVQQLLQRCPTQLPGDEVYARLAGFGLEYGPSFRGIRELHVGDNEVLARVRLPEIVGDARYAMHPAFLDACLHAYPFVIENGQPKLQSRSCYLPISLEKFASYRDGLGDAWVHTRLRTAEDSLTQIVNIQMYDANGEPVAHLQGLKVRLLPLDKLVGKPAQDEDVFYSVRWRKSARTGAGRERSASAGTWILFADDKGIAPALATCLQANGDQCHLVYRGMEFCQRDRRTWTIDDRRTDDYNVLLQQIASDDPSPIKGAVYLWGLDAPPADALTPVALRSGSETICRGALNMLCALTGNRSASSSGLRLWFVTADTQNSNQRAQQVHPLQACLWGLGRTIAIEYPNIWGGLIDVRSESDIGPMAEALAAELIAPDGESQIALAADGGRSVARLVRQTLATLPERPPRVRPDATYLIAGGLGMLGTSTAKWLIQQGAKHILLSGRSASPDRLVALFSAAERSDADIRAAALDISREDEVEQLFRTVLDGLPPLKGVVHSAGILDDGILARLSWERFAPLFEPRVYGSWLLHEWTKSLDLDFFILNSSLLSVLGSAGQANYTSSSAFLDGLAAHRRSLGLPAMAINWCAWSEGGLATVSGARGQEMWSTLGMKDLSPRRAMELFDQLMRRDVGQIALAAADWHVYGGKVGRPAFLSELSAAPMARRSASVARAAPDRTSLPPRTDLGRVTATQQGSIVIPQGSAQDGHAPASVHAAGVNGGERGATEALLQRHIMAELGFDETIDVDRPLNEVGLDSLRSVSLANRLEDAIGIPISVTELIAGPSISRLTEHVLELMKLSPSSGHVADLAALAAAQPNGEADRAAAFSPADMPSPHPTNGTNGGNTFVEQVYVPAAHVAHEGANSAGMHATGSDAAVLSAPQQRYAQTGNGLSAEVRAPELAPARPHVSREPAKWLISPRPTPRARARLFCFPYAGGGLVTFRSWPQLLGDAVEVVAVEPPGRGTRIDEAPVEDFDTFIDRLLPELTEWMDRPAAFFGHCLGGLTMFVAARALPDGKRPLLSHMFACGARPPHLLRVRGEFEDNLVYDMMLHPDFDPRRPAFAQSDEIFAEIIRQFNTSAANEMLSIRKLRDALLPTIRAEFGMAFNYVYRAAEPFSFPITSFVGDADPWVSENQSARWADLTSARFNNQLRPGSHFLIAEDRAHILQTIHSAFVAPLIDGFT
jgi:acyl transferase domain-containing protein/surfactin synthase thioesterase subunit/acyl carrier protein